MMMANIFFRSSFPAILQSPINCGAIQSTCFLSLIFWKKISFKKSMVRVELEAITREDKVDMEADSTKRSPPLRGSSPLSWDRIL